MRFEVDPERLSPELREFYSIYLEKERRKKERVIFSQLERFRQLNKSKEKES